MPSVMKSMALSWKSQYPSPKTMNFPFWTPPYTDVISVTVSLLREEPKELPQVHITKVVEHLAIKGWRDGMIRKLRKTCLVVFDKYGFVTMEMRISKLEEKELREGRPLRKFQLLLDAYRSGDSWADAAPKPLPIKYRRGDKATTHAFPVPCKLAECKQISVRSYGMKNYVYHPYNWGRPTRVERERICDVVRYSYRRRVS